MFPVRDRLPTRSVPFITYALIAVNVAVFVWQGAVQEAGYTHLVDDYGFTPRLFLRQPFIESPTIFTSMFMHAGILHVGTNMLFLWIFGDNIEDALGHARYTAFYLLGGIAAAMAQLVVDPSSRIPMVGASGAVAAVLAGYLSLYPRSPITIVNPIPLLWFIFGILIEVPAWVVAVEFFAMNLLGGFSSLARRGGAAAGGIAVFAHVGGFVAGLILIRILIAGRERITADRWRGWRPPR